MNKNITAVVGCFFGILLFCTFLLVIFLLVNPKQSCWVHGKVVQQTKEPISVLSNTGKKWESSDKYTTFILIENREVLDDVHPEQKERYAKELPYPSKEYLKVSGLLGEVGDCVVVKLRPTKKEFEVIAFFEQSNKWTANKNDFHPPATFTALVDETR